MTWRHFYLMDLYSTGWNDTNEMDDEWKSSRITRESESLGWAWSGGPVWQFRFPWPKFSSILAFIPWQRWRREMIRRLKWDMSLKRSTFNRLQYYQAYFGARNWCFWWNSCYEAQLLLATANSSLVDVHRAWKWVGNPAVPIGKCCQKRS